MHETEHDFFKHCK